MSNCEALIIGGSAGSLEVLLQILPGLSATLPFPIIIVLHRKSGKDSMLPDLLAAKTALRVKELEEKESLEASTIYVAPPDYHLLFENDKSFALDSSEKVNFSRPSIDVSFQSASEVFGATLAALLLSGANSDGSAGLKFIKNNGGLALVQAPETAVVSFMPEAALELIQPDAVLTPAEMPAFINNLAN